MKNRLNFLVAVLVALMMLTADASAFSLRSPKINAPKAFQAQFTLQVGGAPPEHGTMYYSHGRIREEVAAANGGPKTITIIDPLNKTIYQVEEQTKSFKIEPWDPKSALLSEALKRTGKHRFVQTQTIDGQECDNFEIQPKEKDLHPYFVFVNRTTRYPVLLTMENPDPSKQIHIEWTKVSPGYQAAIMFAPPLGYTEQK
jgi:hypothetical protein